MSKVYVGYYEQPPGPKKVFVHTLDFDGSIKSVDELDPKPSQDIVNHSPDGFNWGYSGSGPSQLALAILYDYTDDKDLSLSLYHEFMKGQISQITQYCVDGIYAECWRIDGYHLQTWIDHSRD